MRLFAPQLSSSPISCKTTRDITTTNARGEISETRTEAFIDGIWYTISRNRMTYNAEGKRTSLENLAGQVTTTAWDGWPVTYNGENRPVLWECVSPNSSLGGLAGAIIRESCE